MLTLSLASYIAVWKAGTQITATAASSGRSTHQAHVSRFTHWQTGESHLGKDLRATLIKQHSQSLCMQVTTSQEVAWENALFPRRILQACMILCCFTVCMYWLLTLKIPTSLWDPWCFGVMGLLQRQNSCHSFKFLINNASQLYKAQMHFSNHAISSSVAKHKQPFHKHIWGFLFLNGWEQSCN